MPGRKPDFSLAASAKDAPRGQKKKYLDIGAAWPNDYGGFNFKLGDGVKIRLKDGTIITGKDFWITLFDKRDSVKADAHADDDWGDSSPPRLPTPRASADFGDPSPHSDEDAPADPADDMPF